MTTGVVCHYGKVKTDGLLASGRIARLLADRYGFDLVDTPEAGRMQTEGLENPDYCIVVSSAAGFADPELREAVGELAARAGTYIFVQNDFMTEPAGQIGTWHERLGKEHSRVVWSTIPSRLLAKRADKERSRYVNWNMLTYQPEKAGPRTHNPALFYYGAHRRERIPYFKKWLATDEYPVVISTSKRVFGKWRETLNLQNESDAGPILRDQMTDVINEMGKYGTVGVYLEDEHSHKVYTSPANRFYEMLSARMPMVIDPSCGGTFQQAGYKPNDIFRFCYGKNFDHVRLVHAALRNAEEMAEVQQKLWARDYRAELEEQIAQAERLVGLHPA